MGTVANALVIGHCLLCRNLESPMLNIGTGFPKQWKRDERRVLNGVCGDGFLDGGATLRRGHRGLVYSFVERLSILVTRRRGHVRVYAPRLLQ